MEVEGNQAEQEERSRTLLRNNTAKQVSYQQNREITFSTQEQRTKNHLLVLKLLAPSRGNLVSFSS